MHCGKWSRIGAWAAVAAVGGMGWASPAQAAFSAPSGYQTVNLGVSADAFGISPGGRLATIATRSVNGVATKVLTLYDTWQTGRHVLNTLSWSNGKPTYYTDITFINDSALLVGENGVSNAIWSMDFSGALPSITQKTSDGSYPSIQSMAFTPDRRTVIVSGANSWSLGDLYVKTFTPADQSVHSLVARTGAGSVGNIALTAGGSIALLDNDYTTGKGYLHLYDAAGSALATADLTPGGGSGAYGLAIDDAGIGYATTGGTLTRVRNLESASPQVDAFGAFSEGVYAYPTGLAFTGIGFQPDQPGQTGALIVNGVYTSEGALFAVVPVPEPASLAWLVVGAAGLLARRRRGSSSMVR